MKIIPSVLFLTFGGFLTNDCKAMLRGSTSEEQPILHPEDSGEIEVTSPHGLKFRSVLMLDAGQRLGPDFLYIEPLENFSRYKACFITFPDLLHKSSDLVSETAENQGYIEPTYVPHAVEVMALGVKYYEFEENWHEHNPALALPYPESEEFASLYITIPNTKQVLHKLFREIPASPGVDNNRVKNLAYQKIQDNIKAQRKRLASRHQHQ